MTICANCDRLASHVIMLAGRAICDTCDDHTRWCACGLLLAGSTRQILAMAEVHWRTCGTWQLLTYDPRFTAVSGLGIGPSQRTIGLTIEAAQRRCVNTVDPLGLATSTNCKEFGSD